MANFLKEERDILVIGHKSPDTDSICSAIAYAHLKNQTDRRNYVAARCGDINRETEYVLSRFGMDAPLLYEDVSTQVQDISIRPLKGVNGNMTMHEALVLMHDSKASTLPIVENENRLKGLITIKDLALANMSNMNEHMLAQSATSFENILKTMNGTLICGDISGVCRGKVIVGAGGPEVIEPVIEPGDIIISSPRYETQLCAIELEAACVIVCNGAPVGRSIQKIAEKNGTIIISTPFDTFTAACMINQSIPISYYMTRDIMYFNLSDSVEEASEVMGKVRHVYFPVLDDDGLYCGVVSRRNLLNLKRKELILVDHNERTQCVEGHSQAKILEIIDHHRVANVETSGPVYFRNQPVGCTATIIHQMYMERGVSIPANIAGILCSAILSDTLMFKSPTCTAADEQSAHMLALIAGINIEELANAMFEAGESLENRSVEEIFFQDYKIFKCGRRTIGVGQGSFVSPKTRDEAKELVSKYLPEALHSQHLDMAFYMLTSIKEQSSLLLCAGDKAEDLIKKVFMRDMRDGAFVMPGMISRKKQFMPPVLGALKEMK